MEQSSQRLANTFVNETVENYSAQLTRDQELASNLRASALSRLVWLSGISGFVIINAKSYLDSIRGNSIAGTQILWLILPWILTAFLAIVSHVVIDEWSHKENLFYSGKKSAIDLHRIDVGIGRPNMDEFSAIIRDIAPDVKELRGDANKWFFLARLLERTTFVMMLIAFLSLGVPLVFP